MQRSWPVSSFFHRDDRTEDKDRRLKQVSRYCPEVNSSAMLHEMTCSV
jgi:hypothetical protein